MVTARATARTWLKRVAVTFGVACLVLAGVYGFACWWGVQIPIDVQTTRVLGPVGADGRIDYAAAIDAAYSAGVTADNNAAVLMLVAVGSTGSSDVSVGELLKRIGAEGADAGIRPLVTTKVWAEGRGVDVWEMDQAIDKAGLRPWLAEQAGWEFEQLGAYLVENKAALDLLVEAGKRERFWWPTVRVGGKALVVTQSEPLGSLRHAAKMLAARAMMRARSEPGLAVEDALTVIRLGRHLERGSSLSTYLIGSGIKIFGCYPVVGMLRELPTENLVNVAEATIDEDAAGALVRVLDVGERYRVLDGIWGSVPDVQGYPMQWGNGMRVINARLDQAVEALKDGDRLGRRAKLEAIASESRKNSYLEMANGGIFAGIMMPSVVRTAEPLDRAATVQELVRVAIEVEMFRRKAGRYPATLAEAGIAGGKDFLTGAAVVYRRQEKGFVVYSVGVNGVDDGGFGHGDWETNEAAAKTADDVAVRVE